MRDCSLQQIKTERLVLPLQTSQAEKTFRHTRAFWLRIFCALLWVGFLGNLPVNGAEERTFPLAGQSVRLEDVSAKASVYFRSMRFNRALRAWNVEASITNISAETLTGPFVLVVDSQTNTTGLSYTDGVAAGKSFLEVSGDVADGALSPGENSVPRTLTLGMGAQGAPVIVFRLFAQAVRKNSLAAAARSLNEAGQPLPGVTVEETGPLGARSLTTDLPYGVATVGQSAGEHRWQFTKINYLPVWRRQVIGTNNIEQIVSPRLTRRNPQLVTLTPLSGGVLSNAAIEIVFAPGAVSLNQVATLTPLTAQTLPALLPLGWSPMQAFWLELSGTATPLASAKLRPFGSINSSDTTALVRWNSQAFAWDVVELITGAGTNLISTTLPGAGAFAWAVADAAPNTPPPPQINQPLLGVSVAQVQTAALSAGGSVDPVSSPASRTPELVTGTALVRVTNSAGILPSGQVLRCDVREEYRLADETRRVTPAYENFIVGYQRPGGFSANTVQASFPVRPLRLFGSEELEAATVRVEVLAPESFPGTLLSTNGGQLGGGDLRLIAGVGLVNSPQATRLRMLNAADFTDVAGGLTLLRAFDLTLPGVSPGRELMLRLENGPTNAFLVIARVLHEQGLFDLEPVARLKTDGQGRVTTLETNSAARLPGIIGSGQYVLARVDQAQVLVQGIARNSQNQPTGNLLVRLGPWKTFSRSPGGEFALIAPAGANQLTFFDLVSGDAGEQIVPISAGQVTANVIGGVASTGPRVASISPTNNATAVPRVTGITIRFSRAVNPATLLNNGVKLLGPAAQPVAGSLSLNLANTIATSLPAATLDPATQFTVALSTNIADLNGRTLEGERQFTFTTVALSVRDPAAQLIIYEPGATNVPQSILANIPAYTPNSNRSDIVVRGTPGTADPNVAVVLVNETSGETATVLSKPDGSFTSVIEGGEEDFISATFINLNGTRVYVPVSRQEFDNGFVGLYRQGGILEAQSDGGPVQVLIEPEAIQTKTKLRLKTLNLLQLARELGGVQPEAAKFAAGAITIEGDGQALQEPVKVKFNVDLTAAGYPTNAVPKEAAIVLARVVDTQDVKSFEVLDQLKFTPATLPPSPFVKSGLKKTASLIDGEQATYGVVESVIGLVPGAGSAQTIFKYLMVPLLIGGKPIVVKGRVLQSVEVTRIENPLAIDNPLAGGFSYGQLPRSGAAGKTVDAFNNAVDQGNNLLEQLTDGLFGKPLSGAFITLQNFQTPGIPGRLRPGMIYATSDRDGRYLMVAPTTPALQLTPEDIYLLIATHPRFHDSESQGLFALTDISIAGVAFKNFVFRDPLPFNTPPQVNVAHTPAYPAPGQVVEVQVNAAQGFAGAPTVNVFVESVFPATQSLAGVRIFGITNQTLSGNRTRWTGQLQATNLIRGVGLRVSAVSASGTVNPAVRYRIDFDGAPPVSNDPIPVSETNDNRGPSVVASFPVERGYVTESGEIRLQFTEPIDRSVEQNVKGITLSGGDGARAPAVRLSQDQTELTVQFAGLKPDAEYALTLTGDSIRDLNGNKLDQRPSTKVADSFTLNFRTAPATRITVPGIVNGRGSAISGSRLYVLDAASENLLRTFDISNPEQPTLLSSVRVVGAPRDLVVIPHYQFKVKLHGEVKTSDLVAVVGGNLDIIIDDLDSVIVPGQYLRVFDMGDPTHPVELAAPIVSYRVGSAVTKVRWSPPHLVYQEFAADLHQIAFVDLQELIIGFNATRAEIDIFPAAGKPGQDFNGDGDYVDLGTDLNGDGDFNDPGESKPDTMPIPERRPAEFFGKKSSHLIDGTTQKILDFSVSGGTIGVTLSRGVKLTAGGHPTSDEVPPQYRTLTFNGFEVNPGAGSLNFANGDYPSRVAVFDGLPIEIDGRLETPVVALVSLSPDRLGRQSLAVIDITLPESPYRINELHFPDEIIGGNIHSIDLREDGKLEMVTSSHVLLLDSTLLARTNAPDGQIHPAIVGFIPGAGARTKSVGTSPDGVRAVAEGGRNQLVQTSPAMSFVYFPDSTTVIDPRHLPLGDEALNTLLGKSSDVPQIIPARVRPALGQISQLFPADPAVHYHVMVEAPGGSGPTIKLGLESLSRAGWPVPNKGAGFAPVRAVASETLSALGITLREKCDASIRALTAYQMSSDLKSPFYNRYLSRPFVVVYEGMSIADVNLQRLTADREILFSTANLRAFIEPTELNNTPIAKFAAKIDTNRKVIYPVASVTVPTLDVGYIPGDNVPPMAGDERLPGTMGTVSGHNGEIRTEAADMVLPSPRMPIEIERTIGSQDTYEGPFGLGWDFNYNQRITELQPQLFPAGAKMPLIARGTVEDSVIGSSKDVLFHSGAGRIVLFQWIDDKMPPEYATDPLVTALDYAHVVSDYFLPEPGSFDLLVKFKDGKYERLTSDGMRFRYDAGGRLESINDRFPKNRHELEYDRSGWLIRIDDRSVNSDRFVEFGYYRRGSDPDFNSGLDERTDSSFRDGKICRLRDYVGRDVLFFYSEEGLLIRREGIQVAGENDGYAGRTKTHYLYRDCKITGVTVGDGGTTLFAAETENSVSGKPVAQRGNGSVGSLQVDVPRENSAATLEGQKSSTTQADGRKTEHTFDAFGYVAETTVSGAEGAASTTKMGHNKHGQTVKLQVPEGAVSTAVYDTNNPVFRSRGNLLSMAMEPGTRGGESYTETYHYDARYNLPSGTHKNANDFNITYELTSEGRAVSLVRSGNAGAETFTYDANGRVATSVDILGLEMVKTYNATTGFLETSRTGDNTTTYAYGSDLASQLGQPATVTPPEGAIIRMRYNRELQEVETARGESIQQTAYDEQGRPASLRDELGDGKVRVSRMVYDAKGFMTNMKTEGVEVDGTETLLEYEFTPDQLSRVKSVKHPGGLVQTFDYDNRDNRIRTARGTYVEEYSYDLHNNLVSLKQGDAVVLTTAYDGLDRPKTVTRKTGTQDEIEESTYFKGGEIKTHVVRDTGFGVSESETVEEIDELGRTVRTIANGTTISPSYQNTYLPRQSTTTGSRAATRRTWNTAGHPTGQSDPNTTSTIQPDGNGRVLQVDRQEDGTRYSDTFTYDSLDHRTSASDLLGFRVGYNSRADGNARAVTNARNNVLTFDHSVLGEVLLKKRADNMEFRFRHDAQRKVKYSGDPAAGFAFSYDSQFRLTQKTQRNGAPIIYSGFDTREMPMTMTPPGGTMTTEYDLQRRPTHQTVGFQGTSYEVRQSYDALGRIRIERYRQNGGAENITTYDFDPAGVLLSTRFREDGADFQVGATHYSDGTRKTCIYPSGVIVNEERDSTGRLIGISDAEGNIFRTTSWQGNEQPKVIQLGATIQQVNQYDARGRMSASRFTRASDGAVLAHLRCQFDAADNVEIRQYLHRNGKADNFSYDAGERIARAQIGGVPTNGGLDRIRYERNYGYNAVGLDYLVTAPLTGSTSGVPAFAATWSGHDAFLLPATVDGFARGPADTMGRVARAQLQARLDGRSASVPIAANLIHDGRGNLVRVERDDGAVVENSFQPNGIRFLRQVTQGGQVIEKRHYVYDDRDRLLEEYDSTGGTPQVLARYYYGDSDAPIAADLRNDTAHPLRRYYYLRDDVHSVMAVADVNGTVVERAWYDAFGQPMIEGRDTAAPVIKRVLGGTGGALLIELSESIEPAVTDPGVGSGIVRFASGASISVSASSGGSAELLQSLAGFLPSSVIRFTPTQALSGAVSLTLNADQFADEWGNRVATQTVTANVSGTPGAVYYSANPQPATTAPLARSGINSPFLFHGQYFDYDTGLIYLRARFYDPYTGMFLEPDPLGYEDSVNLYAGMGNSPTISRDPTGLQRTRSSSAVDSSFEWHWGGQSARGQDWQRNRLAQLRAKHNRTSILSQSADPAARARQAQAARKQSQAQKAGPKHSSEHAAESDPLSFESIVRASRQNGSAENLRTVSMMKRGRLVDQGKLDPSAGGYALYRRLNQNPYLARDPSNKAQAVNPHGAPREIQIWEATSASHAAGLAAHEGEHILQRFHKPTYDQFGGKMDASNYTLQHEAAAFRTESAADRTFFGNKPGGTHATHEEWLDVLQNKPDWNQSYSGRPVGSWTRAPKGRLLP